MPRSAVQDRMICSYGTATRRAPSFNLPDVLIIQPRYLLPSLRPTPLTAAPRHLVPLRTHPLRRLNLTSLLQGFVHHINLFADLRDFDIGVLCFLEVLLSGNEVLLLVLNLCELEVKGCFFSRGWDIYRFRFTKPFFSFLYVLTVQGDVTPHHIIEGAVRAVKLFRLQGEVEELFGTVEILQLNFLCGGSDRAQENIAGQKRHACNHEKKTLPNT